MEKLKKLKLNHVFEALIMITIGFVLIFWPKASLVIMARALAILLFLAGVVMVVSYFVRKEKTFIHSSGFLIGIIIVGVGTWIFFNPNDFTDLIPKIFGLFILVTGMVNLSQTFSLVSYKYPLWWLSLVLAIITIGMGVFLIVDPAFFKKFAVMIIGIFLVYDGVSNIWTVSRVGKYSRKAEADLEPIDVEAVIEDVDEGKK